MDDFHRAVLCTFEPSTDAQLRNDALAKLEALKASADGWTFCLQALSTSAEDRVKFWCLQALVDVVGSHRQNRYASLPEEQKQVLRSALIAWVQAKGAAGTDEAPFVKNKFAQLAVEVLKLDYPQLWPQVFPQLLSLLQNGPVSIDIFLRFLNAIHAEVIYLTTSVVFF